VLQYRYLPFAEIAYDAPAGVDGPDGIAAS
jgi:hypothetical protein